MEQTQTLSLVAKRTSSDKPSLGDVLGRRGVTQEESARTRNTIGDALACADNLGEGTSLSVSTKPNVVVVGSFMMDLIVRADRMPKEGETIVGKEFQRAREEKAPTKRWPLRG